MCPFSLVVDCDLLKDTHADGVKSTSDHVSRLVFLLSYLRNFSLLFQTVKNDSHATPCTAWGNAGSGDEIGYARLSLTLSLSLSEYCI